MQQPNAEGLEVFCLYTRHHFFKEQHAKVCAHFT
jgi:hypothetical protein